MSPAPLAPHPDRLFPAEPGVRDIALVLYSHVAELPIISQLRHRGAPSAETIVTPMELLVRESVAPPSPNDPTPTSPHTEVR